MTIMFKSAQDRAKVEAGFEVFRAKVPGATSTSVATSFGDTHVLRAGKKGGPPLVLLHGAMASSAHVMSELGELLDHYDVYGVDVIGQSVKSADARLSHEGDDFPNWLLEVFDKLGLERAHLYGVSWGGYVARRFAERSPQRIDRLVLMVPAGFVSGSIWAGLTKMMIPLTMYRLFPNEARLRKFADGILSTPDEDWIAYFGDAFLAYNMDMRVPPLAKPEGLAGFDRPTLAIAADGDVSFPGAALLDRVKQVIPHAELELIEGCKHSPPTTPEFRAKMGARIHGFLSGASDRAAKKPKKPAHDVADA